MEKVYVSIDRNHMKQKYFENMIGKIISKVTGCEASIAGPLATQLGITIDNQREHLKLGKPTFLRAYMESLIETVDNSTERWMIEHNEEFRIDEDKIHLAQEAAEQDLFAEDNGDGLGETLSDMVNEMLDKKVGEIKDIAKLVLRLEKEKQDGDKEQALDENDEIEEEDAEDSTGAFDEENGENSDEGEGGNPFGEDNGDDNSTDDGGESSEDSGNPFGEDSADSTGDDSDSGSGNPFDDGGSEEGQGDQGGSEGSGDNPFAGGSEGQEGNSGDEGSGNPFESIQNISKITIGGKRPFYSLRNGDMSGFITGYTRKIYEAPMREAFDQFGQESVQFKDLANKMRTTNKAGLEALISVVAVGSALNFKLDMDKIRDWDLYLADV